MFSFQACAQFYSLILQRWFQIFFVCLRIFGAFLKGTVETNKFRFASPLDVFKLCYFVSRLQSLHSRYIKMSVPPFCPPKTDSCVHPPFYGNLAAWFPGFTAAVSRCESLEITLFTINRVAYGEEIRYVYSTEILSSTATIREVNST